MKKKRVNLANVLPLAKKIVKAINTGCRHIEIAGSLRRGLIAVSDIEIVALPHLNITGIFKHQWESELDMILNGLVAYGKLTTIKSGDKFKSYTINTLKPTIQLDLFIPNEINWGLIMAIRTGPAEYSKHIVTQRSKGGALDDNYRVHGGYLWRDWASMPSGSLTAGFRTIDGRDAHLVEEEALAEIEGIQYVKIPTPDEQQFFEQFIASGWVPPNTRRYK